MKHPRSILYTRKKDNGLKIFRVYCLFLEYTWCFTAFSSFLLKKRRKSWKTPCITIYFILLLFSIYSLCGTDNTAKFTILQLFVQLVPYPRIAGTALPNFSPGVPILSDPAQGSPTLPTISSLHLRASLPTLLPWPYNQILFEYKAEKSLKIQLIIFF